MLMTEDAARRLCAELMATFTVRRRKGKPYLYVTRWVPARVVIAAGYRVTGSNGQSFDRYVCPLAMLVGLSEETLRQRIAALPVNPNKHAVAEIDA